MLETYREQGFVVLKNMLTPRELEAVRSRLQEYLDLGASGRNNFEGERTQRVYSLVGRGTVFQQSALHPRVLEMLDQLLLPGYLLTASQAICIHPDETPQPIHYDDTFYLIPRPRPAVSVSTMWALDDFTEDNGATEVIPGSHLWADDKVDFTYRGDPNQPVNDELQAQLVPLVMKAGSCAVFAGTLLHRGGANRTEKRRRAISHQYCEPWGRQQENFFLSVPPERVARMPERLRRLLGYSIHPPFMGQVAGRHPDKTLDPDWMSSLEVDDQAITHRQE